MEKPNLEDFVSTVRSGVSSVLRLNKEEEAVINNRIYNITELTRDIYSKSESIPELLFAKDVFALCLRFDPEMICGSLDDEEMKDFLESYPDKTYLEMFVNPRDLFLDGKIRPDIAFRRGVGNYIIFEIDSFLYHSNQQQLMKDKIRERKIQSLGHPVFRFSAKEVLDDCWGTAGQAIKILQERKFLPEERYG